MGTNYYLNTDYCPCCGHPRKKVHLGKSSYGWKFLFRKSKKVRDFESFCEFIKTGNIENEYGEEVDEEDLLEWGEDISYKFYCPEYSLITSGDCDFLSVDHTKEMEQINDEDYACIEFAHDYTDYVYVNEKVVKEHIMEMFKCVDSYEDLAIFISHYKDLISKI